MNSSHLRLISIAILSIACTSAAAQSFHHPGILNNQAEFDFVRGKLEAHEEPWTNAFNRMKGTHYASFDYTAKPHPVVEAGPYSKPEIGATDEKADAIAAYTHALLWELTGDKAHAKKAIEILNAWSAQLKEHKGHNAPLQSAWVCSVIPRAAEILRFSDSGWTPADIERFGSMLRTAYLPYVEEGRADYNGNWELSMIEAMISAGVFLDDHALFQKGVAMWRKRVPAYFYLTRDGELPHAPPGGTKASKDALIKLWYDQSKFVDGLAQETCRDFGHTQYGLAAMANAAETARQQGVDLYGEEAERITKAMEFHAAFILGKPVPDWLGDGKLKLSTLPTWEIAYNEFHDRLGMSLPQTEQLIAKKVRPAAANHHMAWETLTHAELGSHGLPPAKPAN
jgi:hypothetical protein